MCAAGSRERLQACSLEVLRPCSIGTRVHVPGWHFPQNGFSQEAASSMLTARNPEAKAGSELSLMPALDAAGSLVRLRLREVYPNAVIDSAFQFWHSRVGEPEDISDDQLEQFLIGCLALQDSEAWQKGLEVDARERQGEATVGVRACRQRVLQYDSI